MLRAKDFVTIQNKLLYKSKEDVCKEMRGMVVLMKKGEKAILDSAVEKFVQKENDSWQTRDAHFELMVKMDLIYEMFLPYRFKDDMKKLVELHHNWGEDFEESFSITDEQKQGIIENFKVDVKKRKLTAQVDIDLSQSEGEYKLPDDLYVKGRLHLSNSNIHKLPKGLEVEENLDIRGTFITELPDDLVVGGSIHVDKNLEERAEELRSRGQIKKQVVIYGYDGKL